jgi:hypothetical protein
LTARKEKASAPDQAPRSHHQPLMTRLQLAGFNLQKISIIQIVQGRQLHVE